MIEALAWWVIDVLADQFKTINILKYRLKVGSVLLITPTDLSYNPAKQFAAYLTYSFENSLILPRLMREDNDLRISRVPKMEKAPETNSFSGILLNWLVALLAYYFRKFTIADTEYNILPRVAFSRLMHVLPCDV